MIDCTIISCVYGDSHDRFVADWADGIGRLSPAPADVIVSTDRPRDIPGALVRPVWCSWAYPQAFHLHHALEYVETTWVWIHDIDDVAFPDALEGLENVTADVWQLGYVRSDGEEYLPPRLTASELLEPGHNPFVAGSCVRTSKLREVGGFRDVALQDWALWRALARAGATFESSSRPHFHYRRHEATRGATELTAADRAGHIAEMLAWEEFCAIAV